VVKKQELTGSTHKKNTDFIIILHVFSSKCSFIDPQKVLGAEWWTWKTFRAVCKKIMSIGFYGAHDIHSSVQEDNVHGILWCTWHSPISDPEP
jgi:hypothetical protein